ncbi:MAG: lysine-2,3-aminomutase-like protein [Alphaproteobacteria bacterium]|nr:lysine-2,3-aminomutase-like protein [Alphaproteobacteria bacterium]
MTVEEKGIRSLDDLVGAGFVASPTPALRAVVERYPVSITTAMARLIDPADPADPIAAQFVPTEHEAEERSEERADPIGDAAHSPIPGLVHRYPDRVLLSLLHACPVYCRFCFRRGRVGPSGGVLSPDGLEKALAYIRDHHEIWEVVFSGGDPFVLSPRRLAEVVRPLNAMDHVKILRFHTRVPVVDPARVTNELVAAIKGRAPVYVLLHCNHPRELTAEARAACARLIDGGVTMLSQSVLLKGVNDTPETLEALMRAFVETRIVPHYLHHGDLALGTSHFRLPLARAQALLKTLRGRVSGLCQPTYVLDIPGGYGKVPVGPTFAKAKDDGWSLQGFKGDVRFYKDCL